MNKEDKQLLLDAIEKLADAIIAQKECRYQVAEHRAQVVIGMIDALRSVPWFDNDE